MSEEKQTQYKLKLKTGKLVVLRDLDIDDQRESAKIAGQREGLENQMALAIVMQEELLKRLLISIDGKVLKGQEKENLKKVFSFKEYGQVVNFVKELLGNDEMPEVEVLTS